MRIELIHRNQCNGEISDGFIVCDKIESHEKIHDLFMDDVFISKVRGKLSGNIIFLEDKRIN